MSESTTSCVYLLLHLHLHRTARLHASTAHFNWYHSGWEAPQGCTGHLLRLPSKLVSAERSARCAAVRAHFGPRSELLSSKQVISANSATGRFSAYSADLGIFIDSTTGCRYRCLYRCCRLSTTGYRLQVADSAHCRVFCILSGSCILMYKILWV